MKKRLAIKPDYKKIQIDEIDKVISQLKKGGTPEKDVNKIKLAVYTNHLKMDVLIYHTAEYLMKF